MEELSQMLHFLLSLIIKVQRDIEIKDNKFKINKEKHVFMQHLFKSIEVAKAGQCCCQYPDR